MKNFGKGGLSDLDSKVGENLYNHLEDTKENNDISTKEYDKSHSDSLEERVDTNDISTLISQDLKYMELSVVGSTIKQPLNDLKKQINIHHDSGIISMTPEEIRDTVVNGKNFASSSIKPDKARVPLWLQKLAI